MTRKYLGTITLADLRSAGRPGSTRNRLWQAIGPVQGRDVGKQYFDVDGVLQVENDEQRERREVEAANLAARYMASAEIDPAPAILEIARAGARVHQLRFARERLERLKAQIAEQMDGYTLNLFTGWIDAIDYAIAQIRAAEGSEP